MGNGRWSGKGSGRISGNSSVGLRLLGAMFVLLLAGSVLLGSGSRRFAQKDLAQVLTSQVPASPIPASSRISLHSKPDARAILGQLPLIFEPNQGQASPSVKFLSHGAGYGLFLDPTGAVLSMQTAHSSRAGHSEQFVRMKLVGSNQAAMAGTDPLPGKSNYILGNDPKKWHSGIPQFAGVQYASVYPGIDLVFYGNQGRLEYDFKVAPGADPSRAELQFDGASKMELNEGDLVLTGKDDGGLRLQAPQIYQRDGDRRVPVAGRFILRAANRVGFEIGSYDRSRELIIDPVLIFSSYFGGSGSETLPSVAVNGNGNIYLVGTTQGSPENSFPDPGPIQTLIGTLTLTSSSPSHIFVTEIDPSLPAVVYETFIGGSGTDTSAGVGVDGAGNAYIAGNTSSTDFPTIGIPYQSAPLAKTLCTASPTCTSLFVSVLNPAGAALTYSSYLSGNGDDQASGMAIDTKGDVFITGTTTSNNPASLDPPIAFPASLTPAPFQFAPNDIIQFFVTEINTGPQGILYSTYFGGGPVPGGTLATGGGITVDSTGNIYFTGTTNFYNSGQGAFGDSGTAGDFPILNAYQPCLDTVPPITLLNPNPCSAPASTPYPTDAFVAKLNPNYAQSGGAQLLFSTYLGGTVTDTGAAIAIDAAATNIYLTGSTNSPDFTLPTGSAAFQLCLDTPPVVPANVPPCPVTSTPTAPAPFDAYVARLSNPAQSTTGVPLNVALTYFSYLGGSGNDNGLAIAVDSTTSNPLNDALVTGSTSSTNFPVTLLVGPIQSKLGLGAAQNAFFAHIDTTTVTGQAGTGSYVTYFGGNGSDRGTSIAVDTNLNTYFAGDTTSNNGSLQTANPVQSTLKGTSNAFVVKLEPANDLCLKCVVPTYSQTGIVSAGNPLTITFTVTNEGPDPATGIFVTGTVSPGVTFNSATAGGGTCSAPSSNAVVCQILTLQAGSTSAVAFQVTSNGACTSCSATATVVNVNNTTSDITASAPFVAGGYAMSVSPSAQTVQAGLPAPYTVSVAPTKGVFGSPITLSCGSLPTGATCSFTTTSVTLNGGVSPASVVLNLTTTAQPQNTITSALWRRSLYAFWLMVPGMALFGLGAGGKRRGRKGRVLGLLMLSVLFGLVLLQPSCSSPKTQPTVAGTPSGTYSLTVTATSGTFTQSLPISLTVIP